MTAQDRVGKLKAAAAISAIIWLLLLIVSVAVVAGNQGQTQYFSGLALIFLSGGLFLLLAYRGVRRLISAIEENELLLDVLMSHSGEMLGIADLKKQFLFISPPSGKFLGASLLETVHPEDRDGVEQEMNQLISGQAKVITSIHRRQLPGRKGWRWVDRRAALIRWKGHPAILVMYRDVTERRTEEESRIRAQRMEALGNLAGAFAHDINNYMMSVTGYPSLLLDENSDLSEEVTEVLEEVVAAGRRTSELCKRLLSFARKQVIEPTVFDVNELVYNTIPLLKRVCGDTIDLWVHSYDQPLRVKADSAQLEQVLVNLVVNARDAMPRGGIISIDTKPWLIVDEESVRLGIPEGNYGRIRVVDNGTGMSEEVLVHIFEPFYTTKSGQGGTGLGLSSSYGIMRRHGGAIDVETELGKGSQFSVFLPITGEREERVLINAPLGEIQRGRGQTIMLVEDDTDVAKITRRMLEGLGYRVAYSSSPRSALEGMRGAKIDMLMADLMLPLMRGDELADLLIQRGMLKEGCCLICSSFAHDDFIRESRESPSANRHQFIQKPYTLLELSVAIARILNPPGDGG